MGFPVWYATVTALHVNGVWVDRISFPLNSKPVVELALLPSRQYAYVLDEKRVLPVGPYAVDFVKDVLGINTNIATIWILISLVCGKP